MAERVEYGRQIDCEANGCKVRHSDEGAPIGVDTNCGNSVDSSAETWFTTDMTKTFQIKTWSDTRSNRRDRTYTVQAAHAQDAIFEARMQALSAVRHNVTVCAEIVDVDGHGAPQDCEHNHERLHGGWVLRANGGRDCKGCAA